jgi:FKBP-type peptidyl-prolyl cis-trans isomerase
MRNPTPTREFHSIEPLKGAAHMRTPVTLAFVLMVAAASAQTTTVKTTAPADVAAPPADAVKTPSGLASKVIKPGTGKVHPAKTDSVTVQYTGWTTDGTMFDSSIPRGEPATFPLDQLIAGWTEGLQLMVAGETRRLWIPEQLAYRGQLEPKGMLVFDVELIKIE